MGVMLDKIKITLDFSWVRFLDVALLLVAIDGESRQNNRQKHCIK